MFTVYWGFPGSLAGEEPACQCRRPRFNPWVGKISLTRKWQYSCLENSIDRGAWQATVHGINKSQTWLSSHTRVRTHTHTHTLCIITYLCVYLCVFHLLIVCYYFANTLDIMKICTLWLWHAVDFVFSLSLILLCYLCYLFNIYDLNFISISTVSIYFAYFLICTLLRRFFSENNYDIKFFLSRFLWFFIFMCLNSR